VQRAFLCRVDGRAGARRDPPGSRDAARPRRGAAPDDYGLQNYGRFTAELATKIGADVVCGFSFGASVALELVASGAFAGPAVLLGISLSAKDEPVFFRAIVRSGRVLGGLPTSVLAKAAASMVKRIPVSNDRRAELREDFSKNNPQHMRRAARIRAIAKRA
jgi:hypothetical protein